MWLLMAMGWAGETEVAPVLGPGCLEGAVDGRSVDLEMSPILVTIDVLLRSRCSSTVHAFRAHVEAAGETEGLVWSLDIAGFRPPVDPGERRGAHFVFPVGTTLPELWLVGAPFRKMRFTWTTQAVVLADGTVLALPDLEGEAIRGGSPDRDNLADFARRLFATPVYVVK